MQKFIFLMMTALSLTGCSHLYPNSMQTAPTSDVSASDNSNQRKYMHFYVEQLTRQLLSTANPIDVKKSIAVGTILPTDLKSGKDLPTNPQLGLQIQESLLTLMTQAGLSVIEYKTMPAIKIETQYDAMLSRDIDYLNNQVKAEYFLTGTYTMMEQSTMVNLRLIEVPSNRVIAAATDYIPSDVMWSQTKVRLKDNQIYRGAY
jgi:TolB-like protein